MGNIGKFYHKNKMLECRKNGIRLLQFWSSQWELKSDIIKSMISIRLSNSCNEKIYARKCGIIEISTYEKDIFLEENHLMGKDKSTYKLALVNNDIIYAVMTFRESRYNKNIKWELSRFSVKKNTIVIGGFSKLLSYFRKVNDGSIVSYADLMYSNGDVYVKNGFELLHETGPKYWYVKDGTEILEHRSKYMKKEKTDITEKEIMEKKGYNRIWDSGVMTFVLR